MHVDSQVKPITVIRVLFGSSLGIGNIKQNMGHPQGVAKADANANAATFSALSRLSVWFNVTR